MKDINELVMQAIGEASMCWNPTPTGVFDSENAARIGDELILDAFNRIQSTAYSDVVKSSGLITLEDADASVVQSGIEELAKLRSINADLLEALEELFASYKSLADSGDAGNWSLEEQPEGKKALAAIAKAKGEAQ